MIKNFAVYRISDGYIENAIVYDPESFTYTPPEGFQIVEIPEGLAAGIGSSYINGQFVIPEPPPIEEVIQPQ